MGSFDFIKMAGNYESRKVARFEKDDLLVDTAEVNDALQPYETAISHPEYDGGHWVPVEMYDTKEEAIIGHSTWVHKMTSGELPASLEHRSSAEVYSDMNAADRVVPRAKKTND